MQHYYVCQGEFQNPNLPNPKDSIDKKKNYYLYPGEEVELSIGTFKNPCKNQILIVPGLLLNELGEKSINLLLLSCKFLSFNNDKESKFPYWTEPDDNHDLVCLFAKKNNLDFSATVKLYSFFYLYHKLEEINTAQNYLSSKDLQYLKQYMEDKKVIKYLAKKLAKKNEKTDKEKMEFLPQIDTYIKKHEAIIKAEEVIPFKITFEKAMKKKIYPQKDFKVEIIKVFQNNSPKKYEFQVEVKKLTTKEYKDEIRNNINKISSFCSDEENIREQLVTYSPKYSIVEDPMHQAVTGEVKVEVHNIADVYL